MANAELDRILDNCIAEMRSGYATKEDCLRRYPGHCPTLAPLLDEAERLMAVSDVTMPDDAVDRLEARLLGRASQIRAASYHKGPSVWGLFWSRLTSGRARLLPAAAMVLIALTLASTWAVAASAASLPGMALYPLKLAGERARMSVTFRHEERAHLRLSFAERRLDELETLTEGRSPVTRGLVEAMAAETRLATGEIEEMKAGRQATAKVKLLSLAVRQEAQVLSLLRGSATEAEQRALMGALEAAQQAQAAAGARVTTAEPAPIPSERREVTRAPMLHQAPIRKRSGTPTPTVGPDEKETRRAAPSPTPTRTARVSRTRKPMNTPKPARTAHITPRRRLSQTPSPTPRIKHTRKPTHMPKPAPADQLERSKYPTGESRPTEERDPTPQSTRRSDRDPSPKSENDASR